MKLCALCISAVDFLLTIPDEAPTISAMQYDDRLQIETPENVAFGYEIAGLGARFLATTIDTLILLVVLIVASLASLGIGSATDVLADAGVGWVTGVFSFINFLVFWGYYIIFEMLWNGQTPGKRYMQLRTIDRSGTAVGLSGSIIRNLVRFVDFLPAFYGLGIVVMFIDKQGRRLGDMASGTMVVYDRTVSLAQLGSPATSRTLPPQAPEAAIDLNLPLERLTEGDVELAQNYMARRDGLATERGLIRPILQHLYDQMEVELEEQIPYTEAVERLKQIAGGRTSDVRSGEPVQSE